MALTVAKRGAAVKEVAFTSEISLENMKQRRPGRDLFRPSAPGATKNGAPKGAAGPGRRPA